jgi:hypothetical protein
MEYAIGAMPVKRGDEMKRLLEKKPAPSKPAGMK